MGSWLPGLRRVSLRLIPDFSLHLSSLLCPCPACQSFHEALDSWVKGPGAEPFYIRANLTLPERADPHALCVKAQEILRLVDPAYKRRQEWFCTRVDPLTLRDLDRGTVPNYQR